MKRALLTSLLAGMLSFCAFKAIGAGATTDGVEPGGPGSGPGTAGQICPNAGIWDSSLLTDICWTCTYPIKLLGGVLGNLADAPAGSYDKYFCSCDTSQGRKWGVSAGLFQVAKIVENTRVPFCSPTMGGYRFAKSFMPLGGRNSQAAQVEGKGESFHSTHVYAFPAFHIMDLLVSNTCSTGGYVDFDLIMPSELDPCWTDPEMALYCQPEAVFFNNDVAQMGSGLIDCPACSLPKPKPVDDIFWTAGCWGSIYPMSGHIVPGDHLIRDSSLLAARAMTAMHRRGLAKNTMGEDAICGKGNDFPHLKKSMYKMSMIFPAPEAKGSGMTLQQLNNNADNVPPPASGGNETPGTDYNQSTPDERKQIADGGDWGKTDKCCHAVGEHVFRWGENRTRLGKEDPIYVLFQWVDCCIYPLQ